MPRVKNSVKTRQRRKKILKLAEGYYGGKSKLFRPAKEQVYKSLFYAYRDRKNRKRDFRRLWIARISAACKQNGISYSKFMGGLNKLNIALNRKVLADIAVKDVRAFSELVNMVKEGEQVG